ncbi:hypothetical protein GCM10023094_34010 [Rhodococcus olei]|uniref:SpdD protein n=1 Tax=Rhodococcus olei TaxID=2161675 RepID=A0ABP8P9T7_9NOCA
MHHHEPSRRPPPRPTSVHTIALGAGVSAATPAIVVTGSLLLGTAIAVALAAAIVVASVVI